MDALLQDLRHSLRQLAHNPGFTLVVALSLCLGIGANSAIFSLVNAVLLRKLPVKDPDRLVEVYTGDRGERFFGPSSYPDYLDFREQGTRFSGLVAHNPVFLMYTGSDRSELIFGEIVSANYFSVLGLSPAFGRTFLPEEDEGIGAHPVVVVSYGFWQRRFAGSPQLIGKKLRLNGYVYTVVGIAPPDFKGLMVGLATDVWVPIVMHDQVFAEKTGRLSQRAAHWFLIKGRLKPGVALGQAQAELDTVAGRLAQQYPDSNKKRFVSLSSSSGVIIHPMVDKALFGTAGFLLVVTGLVLLIAAANVANLLLARALERRRQIAIRLAVGAHRSQLIRLLLIESLTLSLLGGALGLLLAGWMVHLLVAFQPPLSVSISLDLGLDSRVVLFTLAISLVTGVICGLAPALKSSRPDLVASLKDEGVGPIRESRKLTMRNALVSLQVAVSLLLLITAGLFLRSLWNASEVDPGFEIESSAVANIPLGLKGYGEVQGREFYRKLLERVTALPDVRSASLAEWLPLTLGFRTRELSIEGAPPASDREKIEVDSSIVGPDYFKTMEIPLLNGRDFGAGDRAGAPLVAIINQAMARRFWPGQQSPEGKRFSISGPGGPFLEVVGVAKDGKYRTLGEKPRPYFFLPFGQNYVPNMNLVVNSTADPSRVVQQLRREIEALDRDLPISDIKTMKDHLGVALFPTRVAAVLLSVFGLLGLLLAAVGLYGVVSYAVAGRTHEIGIHLALGAQRSDVLRRVIGEGMTPVAIGVLLGLGAAFGVTRLLSSILFGITPTDPVTFIGVPIVLIAVALMASFVPARRATRVDPMVVLRLQ